MQSSSVCLLLLLFTSSPTIVRAQPNNNDGYWQDSYKLGYSYDLNNNQQGPTEWSRLNSQTWGEWSNVNVLVDEDTGLIDWGNNNQCGSEDRPSPIDIIPSDQCNDNLEMRVRQFNEDNDCRHPFEEQEDDDEEALNNNLDAWELTPYSLRWYMPRSDQTCMRPTLRLDNFVSNADRRNDEHFVLLWLEVHARSEHVINGRRYDAELQMVHMATTRPNELVIVSVLIDASNEQEDHADFQKYLLDGWQQKAQQEEELCTTSGRRKLERTRHHLRGDLRTENSYLAALQEYQQQQQQEGRSEPMSLYNQQQEDRGPKRQLQGGGNCRDCQPDQYGLGCVECGLGPRRKFFPYNLWPSIWYYSYEGSLTAPPCSGQVHWRIIDTPLSISRRQYKQLTNLLTQSRDEDCVIDTATNAEGENFRPLQTTVTNNRQGGGNQQQVVSHCTANDFTAIVYDMEDQ